MKTSFVTSLILLSLAIGPTVAWAHPVHETMAEIEWNEESQRLEVSLRLDQLDEQWLAKSLKADREPVESWATAYLRKTFRVTPKPKKDDSDSSTYHWVGRSEEGAHVWWFFEIEPADHQRPGWIEQRMLHERNTNYVNRILILDRVPRRSLTLTIQRPKQQFDQAVHEPNSSRPRSAPTESAAPSTDRGSGLDWRRDDKWSPAGYERPVA